MATGDAAVAAGMELIPNSGTAGSLGKAKQGPTAMNKIMDYIATLTVLKTAVTTVGNALLTAVSAAAARTAIGIDLGIGNAAAPNKVPVYNGTSQLTTADPTLGGHAASKQYVDTAVAGVSLPTNPTFGNVTATGHIYVPNSSVATSGWTTAYINGDGRISRGASALKYKKFVSEEDPTEIGDIFPTLVRYQMRGGDGSWQLGYIADSLEGTDAERFIVRIDGEVESIDFIQMLIAQVASLNARLRVLEGD